MPRFMERDIETKLIVWKESAYRKPLILRGARQVGKTRALKEFERRHYENVAYFSLEKINEQTPSEFSQFFVTTKGPVESSRISRSLKGKSFSRAAPSSY